MCRRFRVARIAQPAQVEIRLPGQRSLGSVSALEEVSNLVNGGGVNVLRRDFLNARGKEDQPALAARFQRVAPRIRKDQHASGDLTGEREHGTDGARSASDDAPFAGLAFKIMTDPCVGQRVVLRGEAGVGPSGDTV